MVRTSYSQQQPLCFQSCTDCTQGSRTVHGHKSGHTDFLSSSAAIVSQGFFLSNLQVKKIKQIFFHWRFKVCALSSSLLTTNFLYAFHRDLQTTGKKRKEKTLWNTQQQPLLKLLYFGWMSQSHFYHTHLPKLSSYILYKKGTAFPPQHIQQLHSHPAQE